VYSVEERSAELEIMLVEDESPYDMTGAGWGQSGYVGGQGPWGYGSHPISILALCDLRTNAITA
jgi:hypothetical protein